MTPREFHGRSQVHRNQVIRDSLLQAELLAVYVNAHLEKGATPVRPERFIPELQGVAPPKAITKAEKTAQGFALLNEARRMP